jgi:hypothetical protein
MRRALAAFRSLLMAAACLVLHLALAVSIDWLGAGSRLSFWQIAPLVTGVVMGTLPKPVRIPARVFCLYVAILWLGPYVLVPWPPSDLGINHGLIASGALGSAIMFFSCRYGIVTVRWIVGQR